MSFSSCPRADSRSIRLPWHGRKVCSFRRLADRGAARAHGLTKPFAGHGAGWRCASKRQVPLPKSGWVPDLGVHVLRCASPSAATKSSRDPRRLGRRPTMLMSAPSIPAWRRLELRCHPARSHPAISPEAAQWAVPIFPRARPSSGSLIGRSRMRRRPRRSPQEFTTIGVEHDVLTMGSCRSEHRSAAGRSRLCGTPSRVAGPGRPREDLRLDACATIFIDEAV